MFLSQINQKYTFNEKTWLVTVANWANENRKIPSASLYIEALLKNMLWFGRYDIFARPWQISQTIIPEHVGYISDIRFLEVERYQGSFEHDKILTFPFFPEQSIKLRHDLYNIKEIINTKMMDVYSEPPKELLVKNNVVDWCLDLVRLKHCV